MTLDTKVETQLRGLLARTELGPEGASEVIAELSRPDMSQFATRDYLDLRLANASSSLSSELRTEMHAGFSQLRGEMQTATTELRAEMHAGFSELRAEIRDLDQRTATGFTEVRAEMHTGFTQLRNEIRDLDQRTATGFTEVRAEMHTGFTQLRTEMHSLFRWSIGTTVTMFGILATLIVALR